MAKLQNISSETASKHLKDLQVFFEELASSDVCKSDSGFSTDKDAILRVFKNTSGCNKEDILVRLTLIDSMYSTQMSRRYYALDELAEALAIIAKNKEGKLRQIFLDFAKSPEQNLYKFNYIGDGETQTNLFAECYGIGKDGGNKGVAVSLISKYAYFETEFKFPIYDSIACEMYPLVWHFCGFEKHNLPKLTHSQNGKVVGDKTIVEYVKAINLIINNLNSEKLNYDILDRYMWFVGKICRGNLSLVLSRSEYEEALKVYPPKLVSKTNSKGKTTESVEYFNIKDMDIHKLKFLNRPKNKNVRKFFEFAKFYMN